MSEPKPVFARVAAGLLPAYLVVAVLSLAAAVPLLVYGAIVSSWPAVAAAGIALLFGSRVVSRMLGQANGAAGANFAAALAQARAMAGAREQG